MKITKKLCFLFLALSTSLSIAQDKAKLDDSSYYDFWEGDWYQVVDGVVRDKPRFIVRRGMYASAFEESWQMEGYKAKAWRAWDTRTQQWDFAWVAEIGLFQIWEGRKVDGHWYIYRTFVIDGEEVLSRQAFIPMDENTVIRTSEHSRDDGTTWILRFEETYKRLSHDSP